MSRRAIVGALLGIALCGAAAPVVSDATMQHLHVRPAGRLDLSGAGVTAGAITLDGRADATDHIVATVSHPYAPSVLTGPIALASGAGAHYQLGTDFGTLTVYSTITSPGGGSAPRVLHLRGGE